MLTGGLDRAVRLFMDLVTTPALGKDWSTNLGSEEDVDRMRVASTRSCRLLLVCRLRR